MKPPQARATKLCVVIGLGLAVIGTSAWWAAVSPDANDIAEFRATEDRMYDASVEAGIITDMPHKRTGVHDGDIHDAGAVEVLETADRGDANTQSPSSGNDQ